MPSSQTEKFKKQKGLNLPPRMTFTALHSLPRLPYGGVIEINGEAVHIHNTCNIDSCLTAVYYLYKTDPATKQYIEKIPESLFLINAFRAMDREYWSRAREIIFNKMLELHPSLLADNNLFGSETRFLSTISFLITVKQIVTCSNEACPLESVMDLSPFNDFVVNKPVDITSNYRMGRSAICDGCGWTCRISHRWAGTCTPFFCYPIALGEDKERETEEEETQSIVEDMVPSAQKILGDQFNVFAYTVYQAGHFTCVFKVKEKKPSLSTMERGICNF